ncbi:MAG: hypothetical protein OXC12_05590, partial [Spirochaetaceae bacterium]|nr:hypothetical protein [Spirochaetaceae bacterium]
MTPQLSTTPGACPEPSSRRAAARLAALFAGRFTCAVALVCAGLFAASPAGAQEARSGGPTVVANPEIARHPSGVDHFALLNQIGVSVMFSRHVTVTGTPRIALDIGGATRYATFQSAAGPLALFRYVVQAGDQDTDGIDIVANSLELNGGTITGPNGVAAVLDHPSQSATATRRPVDGVAPSVTMRAGISGFLGVDARMTVVVGFSESVSGLTADDFVISNGTVHDLAVEAFIGLPNSVYSFLVSPDGEGPLTLSLPAAAVQDGVGNGNSASAQIRVLVGDPATVTVTPSTSNTAEGRAVVFALARSKDNGERTIQVEVSQDGDYLSGGTSFGGTFTATPATLSATFAAGATTTVLTFDTDNDYVDEADGSVTLTVLPDPTEVGYLVGTPSAAAAPVRDNDEPLSVAVFGGPLQGQGTAADEGETIYFRLVRSRIAGTQALDLQITAQGDFLASSHPSGLTIPADGRIRVAFARYALSTFVLLNTVDDTTEEDDGSVTLTMLPRPGDPLNPVFGEPAAVTVRDDDAPPAVTVSADAASVAEGEQAGFTISRGSAAGEHDHAVTVQLEMTPTGDFGLGSLALTVTASLAAGATSASRSWKTSDDLVSEADGAVTLRVLPPAAADAGSYRVGAPASATVAVVDDEPTQVSVAPVADSVTEGADALFRFTRVGGGSSSEMEVGATILGHRKIMSDATRAKVENAGTGPDDTVTFAVGATEAVLTITTEADSANEGDGQIQVVVRSSADYQIGGAGSATVLVEDDDIPEVSLRWISPPMTVEDNVWVGQMIEGQDIDYEVLCSGNTLPPAADRLLAIVVEHEEILNHPVNVNYGKYYRGRYPCADHSPAGFGPVDSGHQRYTGPANGEITVDLLPQALRAPDSVRSRCYLDSESGTPQDVRFCPKYTLGDVTSARITVLNRNPTITVEAVDEEVDEGEAARFRLTRIWAEDLLTAVNPSVGLETLVDIEVAPSGSIIAPALPDSAQFLQGETEVMIEVPTVRDYLPGDGGELILELRDGSAETQAQNIGGSYEVYDQLPGITPAGKSSRVATVRVANVDVMPLLSVPDAGAEEGDQVEFVAALSATHDQPVSVDWTPIGGTAEVGNDYSAHAGGTLSFAVGETVKTINVQTTEDSVPELEETFRVSLTNPVQVVLPAAPVTGTITDDDELPVVTIKAERSSILEGRHPKFEIIRQGLTDGPLDVTISLTRDGVDLGNRQVQILTGASSRLKRVWHQANNRPEDDRVYRAEVVANSSYTIGIPSSAQVTVIDDDTERLFEIGGGATPSVYGDAGTKITLKYYVYNYATVPTGAPVTLHSKLLGAVVVSEVPLLTRSDDAPELAFVRYDREYTVTQDDVDAGVILEEFHVDDGIIQSPRVGFSASHSDLQYLYEVESYSGAGGRVDEARGTDRVIVKRLDTTPGVHTVQYYTEDVSAKAGQDYTSKSGTLTFQSGTGDDTFQSVYVPITDDDLDEPYEHFRFVVADNDDATLIYAQGGVPIEDDDPSVEPKFNVFNPRPREGQGHPAIEPAGLKIKVFMTKPGETTGTMSGHDVEFSYETVDGTATAGQDYTATSGRATIQAGHTQFTFWVPIIDDAIDEPQEEFRIRLTEGVHMDIPTDREYQTIQIEDNDDASGEIALSVAPAEVGEGIGAADITVAATFNVSARTSDTEVAVQVAGGTATVGGDFTAVADFTLTIPAHQVSGTAAFTFIPIDDGVPESALETAFVTGTASGFTVKPAGGAELQIRDDDQRGVLTDPPALTVDEGQTGAYIVALTSQPTGDVTVNPSVPAGAAVTVSPASLTFSATAWNTAQTVTVTPVADADAEHEQAIISHGVAGADYGSVDAGQVTATVRDDETPSTAITLRADPASVAEAGGSRAVTVTAVLDQAPLKRATTVRVAVADDMATGGADFTAVGTFDVAIAAGAASGTGSFTLSPIDDDLDEDDETLSVDGQVTVDGAPDPGALPVTGAAVTIVDDDSRGVALSDTVLRFEEGVEQAAYTIALTSAPSHDVTVAVVAPASSDLVVSPTHYYFSDGNWSDAQTVRVAAPADADLTDDEDTLTHQVTGGDYAGIAVNDVAVTVTEPTATQASVRDARGSEGSGALAFEVALDKPIKVPAVIPLYHTEDSTATVGADYLEARGSLTFAPGETRKAITVTLVDDALNEAEERVLLELLLDSNLAPPGETTGMATAFGIVEDDDPLPVVSVVGSAADGWSHGEESDGFLSYKVRLDAPSAREVTVDYATSDQAPGGRSFESLKIATAPVDYAPLAGRLTFAAGETERRLTVAVNDDKVSEDDEVFALQLSNPRNAVLSNQGWGLIRDEDPRGVVLTPPSLTLDEGEAGTYTLALSSQPTDAVTAALTTSGGVTAAPQSLSFTTTDWSTAQTVTVTAQDDDDAVDGTAAVRHAFTGGDYDGRAADDLPVTIRDGDTQGVVLSPTALAVDEGQSAPYTVALASQPTADVTVAIGGMVGTDVSAGPSSLTFTASTWRTAQTVTVRAADDADGVQDQVSLTHTAAGGDYVAVSENLTVTVTDSDTVGLVLSEPTLAVTEDAMASYTVKLATQPAAAVTVTIGGATGTDLTAAPATLTFAAQSWNTAQTVQVTAAKDADAVADEATLTHTAAGGDYVAVSENLTVTVTDIDTAGLVLSETALAVTEDDKANYTVKLASEPTAEVTVTIGGTVDTDLAVTPAILTFTASEWQSAQTVEVAAGKDADSAADEATLTHTATGGDYVAVSENLTVTVTDIDTAGLVLSETALAVTEDDKASYTVKLASEPTAQVTVTIGGITDTDLTVVPASLTFTASEWQTAQTVEVTAAEDADAVTDAATLSHTAGGGDYGSVSKDLPVTVTEIHTAGLVLSETALTVTEGDKASYTVQLASEPTAQVTVTIAGTTGTDLTVAPASLTFTVSEWQTVQTVEVTAAEDADAAVDKPTLSHTAGGGDYGSVSKDLPVTVTELDNAGIVLSHAQLSVTEGAAAAYTVQLASEPTAEVTVTVGGAAGTDLTVDEASLTFTAATWSTAQTVEVTAGEDADAVVDAATLTHAAVGGDYGAVTRGLPVTVTEIHRVGIALTPASLTVTEGAQELYAVALTSEPTAVVTVTIGGMEGTDLEPNKTSLTFTPSGWSTGQTVTVDAGDDADAVNDSAALTHSAAGGDYGAVSRELTVTVTDTDTASTGITLAVAPGSVGESGAATSVTVTGTLSDAAELTDTTVTVTVGASNDGAIEGTDYGTVADLTLTIAAGATSGTATFTLTPTGDEVDEEDETVTVGGAADGFTVTAATVTITDDDTRGIALSPATLSVTEGDEAGYTVALQSEPTGEVTVTVGGTTNTDLSVEPAALTFSTTGWSTAQTVTVDAGADPDAVTDTAPLTHTVAGGDYGTVSRELTVTVTDTDTASTGITLAVAPASVGESAAATSVTVTGTLSDAAELTDTTVTVAVGASDDGATEGTDYATVADLTLTIAAGASSGTATFTITPTGDEVDEEDETVTVGGTVSGFAVTAATVTITDDDTRGIAVSPATLTLNEGSSASYTVVLNSEPNGEVTAAATVGGSGDVSTRPTSLTFTAGNWDEAQTVTVDAQKDADAVSDSATVTHQVSGGDYSSETAGAVAVTVTDTDTASTGITLAVGPAALDESAAATRVTVTGTLDHAPEITDTTVTVTVGATSDAATEGTDYGTVADLTLTIAAGASSGTATFTITPTGDEVDEEDETVTVGGTASGFTVTAATVTITDDDTRGIALNPAALTVTEDGEASYTVALQSKPTGAVTVTVGGTTNTDLSVSPVALTFSTTAWSTVQTVTVDADDDDDAVNDSVALTHTAGGGDYGAVSRNLTVTVTDIDTAAPAMTVELGAPVHDDADGSGTVTLGDMLTYTATARNSGNVPLTGVALRDVLVDSSGDECGTLGIGASCQLSGDHTVSQADVDAGTVANTATGT